MQTRRPLAVLGATVAIVAAGLAVPTASASNTGTAFEPVGSVAQGTTALPSAPSTPTPAQCEAVHRGRTVWSPSSSDVDVRDKYGDTTGEVNADGWGAGSTAAGATRTVRVYGATKEALTDVTYTVTASQGATFKAGSAGTIATPGAGALAGNGYNQAVDGFGAVTISADGKTATVHIDSMPASSSFSFNLTAVLDGAMSTDGALLPIVLNHRMTGSQADCTPSTAVPTPEPTSSQSPAPSTAPSSEPSTQPTTPQKRLPKAGASTAPTSTSTATTAGGTAGGSNGSGASGAGVNGSLAHTGVRPVVGLAALGMLAGGTGTLLVARRRR